MVSDLFFDIILPIITPIVTAFIIALVTQSVRRLGFDIDEKNRFALDFAKNEDSKRVINWLEDKRAKEWLKEQVEATYSKIKAEYGNIDGNTKWDEAIKLGILLIRDEITSKVQENIESNKFKIKDWAPLIEKVKKVSLEFLPNETQKLLDAIEKEKDKNTLKHNDAINRLIFKHLILTIKEERKEN